MSLNVEHQRSTPQQRVGGGQVPGPRPAGRHERHSLGFCYCVSLHTAHTARRRLHLRVGSGRYAQAPGSSCCCCCCSTGSVGKKTIHDTRHVCLKWKCGSAIYFFPHMVKYCSRKIFLSHCPALWSVYVYIVTAKGKGKVPPGCLLAEPVT